MSRIAKLAQAVRDAEAAGWSWELTEMLGRRALRIRRDDGVETSFLAPEEVHDEELRYPSSKRRSSAWSVVRAAAAWSLARASGSSSAGAPTGCSSGGVLTVGVFGGTPCVDAGERLLPRAPAAVRSCRAAAAGGPAAGPEPVDTA